MTWADWLVLATIVVCLAAIPVLRWIDHANRVIDRPLTDETMRGEW